MFCFWYVNKNILLMTMVSKFSFKFSKPWLIRNVHLSVVKYLQVWKGLQNIKLAWGGNLFKNYFSMKQSSFAKVFWQSQTPIYWNFRLIESAKKLFAKVSILPSFYEQLLRWYSFDKKYKIKLYSLYISRPAYKPTP